MTPQEHENGLRAVARKCHTELKQYKKLIDKLSKQILSKHLPEFEKIMPTEIKLKYTPNM